MAIYGTALLSICLLAGLIGGKLIGMAIGVDANVGGVVPPTATDYIDNQLMSRFILRNPVTATPDGKPATGFSGAQVTPLEIANFTNAIQQLREGTRLGIPALFKSNARNHIDPDARAGINEASGAFSAFPKEAGIAAAALGEGDMSPVRSFAAVITSGSQFASTRSIVRPRTHA